MTSPADSAVPVLEYDGKIGDLYRIFLVNLALNIVTLGIWRFWGITRMRRYLWSRTSSGGDRFEYDGTGGQLFVGFLLALLIIFGLFAVAAAASVLIGPSHRLMAAVPILLAELVVVVLAFGAQFSAQRYRLSHTVWRGIRGGVQGSMLAYGARALLYYALTAATLYQLAPWATLRLYERRMNSSSFGSLRFAASGRAAQLYLRFLLTLIAVVALGAVVGVLLFALFRPIVVELLQSHDPLATQALINRMIFPLLGGYLVFGIGAALISASYAAAFYRHVTGHTVLGGLHFASRVSGAAMLGLVLGNALILLVTLGLGMPVVTHRNARFFARNLLANGTLNLAELRQSDRPISRYGEGMFQALDAGAGVF